MSEPSEPLAVLSGRYQVLRQLGKGGMGVVHLAFDRSLQCEVVVKTPLREALGEPGFAERFAREIRSMVVLTHPHVVKIQDVGTHEDVPFCVMQYLSGGSLEQRPRPADPATLRQWLPAVSAALDFVHRQGFLHRDIKPENILFDAHGNAYISDFGVTKVLSEGTPGKGSSGLTGAGLVIGTVGYLAPELIMGDEKVDGRADQYALAVTVYQTLAGRRPFEGNTPSAVLVQQAAGKPAPLRQFAPKVPAAMAEVIERALSQDPDRRFPDCASFAEAVLAASTASPAARPSSLGSPPKAATTAGVAVPPIRASAPGVRKPPTSEDGDQRPAAPTLAQLTQRREMDAFEKAPSSGGGGLMLLFSAIVLTTGLLAGGYFAYQSLPSRAVSVPVAVERFHFKALPEVPVQPASSPAVSVRIVRAGYEGPVRVVSAEMVPGIRVSEATIQPGRSETTVRLELGDVPLGWLKQSLKGLAEGHEERIIVPLRVLPPPQLKLELPAALPPLRAGGSAVSYRIKVIRIGCAEMPARYYLDTEVPAWLEVEPSKAAVLPGENGFSLRVRASADAVAGREFSLPVCVVVDHPGRQLEQQIVLRLPIEPAAKKPAD